jgi:hypothetical protein
MDKQKLSSLIQDMDPEELQSKANDIMADPLGDYREWLALDRRYRELTGERLDVPDQYC